MSYRAPPGMTSSHLRSYHDPNVVHTPVTNYSVSPFWNPASAVVSLPPAAVGTRSITMNRSTRSSTASAAHYQAHALSRPSHIPTVQAITPTYSIASATTYQAPVLPRLSQFPAVKDQAPTHRSERPRTYHNSIYPMPPPPSSPRPRTPSTPPPHADVHPTSTPPPPQGIREYYITFQTRFAPALDITIIKALLWPRRHLWSDNSTEFTLARDTTRLYEVRIPIVAHHFCCRSNSSKPLNNPLISIHSGNSPRTHESHRHDKALERSGAEVRGAQYRDAY